MKKLILEPSFPPVRTEIVFARHLQRSEFFIQVCHGIAKRGAVLADSNVIVPFAERLQKTLGPEFSLVSVPGGEASKTRAMKEKLEDDLLKKKIGRDSLLIGMGGGVVTDLVGYLASTYMR